MTILLTGGGGYIGSHSTLVFFYAGYKAVLFDNFSNSSQAVLAHLRNVSSVQMPRIQGDICNTHLLKYILRKYDITAPAN